MEKLDSSIQTIFVQLNDVVKLNLHNARVPSEALSLDFILVKSLQFVVKSRIYLFFLVLVYLSIAVFFCFFTPLSPLNMKIVPGSFQQNSMTVKEIS